MPILTSRHNNNIIIIIHINTCNDVTNCTCVWTAYINIVYTTPLQHALVPYTVFKSIGLPGDEATMYMYIILYMYTLFSIISYVHMYYMYMYMCYCK